jgi:hypothetical protein
MVQFSDNEIQVLGRPAKRTSKKWIWLVPLFLIGGISLVWGLLSAFPKEKIVDLRDFKTELNVPVKGEPMFIESGIEHYSAVENDVSMYVFHLIDMTAELNIDAGKYTDDTECLILQAADIRKDNGKFVGDFVLNGKRLSSGKRKKGYCAIIDGKITIGMSDTDDVMNRCMAKGGSFFRQYPLVSRGVMQENELKGKSIRRALALKGDKLYVFETEYRESMHDFAEALQDMGVTEAISLVGGNKAYMYWLQDDELYESYDLSEVKNNNFIVFKKKGKQ